MIPQILITSPSLDVESNVSGIAAVTNFIIGNNRSHNYIHFQLGKKDNQKRGIGWIFMIVKSFFSWVEILISNRNIIIHFNFALEKPSIIRDIPFIMAAKFLGKKMVIHVHGGRFMMGETPKWVEHLLRFVLSKHIPKIVLSSLEKEVLIRKFDAQHVFVLPNCIPLTEANLFQRPYPIHGPLNLLFMGRIVESKGIEYVYDACVLLKERQVQFNLFLAGKGSEEKKYIEKFSTLLPNSFTFKGVVSGDDKISLIKKCDIFLLPSTYGEGLPIALLESMSFGLVPITTNDGSMGALVKNGERGFIVNKNSGNEIAEIIAELSRNRVLIEAIGQRSKEYIREQFDPSSYIARLNKIYELISYHFDQVSFV